MIGVSAGLIPFLEHDDANRALDGLEHAAASGAAACHRAADRRHGPGDATCARNSGMVVRAGHKGTVTYVDADRIEIGREVHPLRKFVGLNERTCQNQKPIVKVGDKVEKGQVIADGAATYQGELALGRNVLVAFMSWEGYNFEDAIIISEELVKNDTYTSIHIEEFDVEIRETKLGREEFTRDIPNVSEKALRNLDENGIVQIGTFVEPGDILVGKVSPKTQDRADAGREAAARDLRPGRRGREERFARSAVGRRRHRHRHAEVLPPHEPLRRRAQGVRDGRSRRPRRKATSGSPRRSASWSTEIEEVLGSRSSPTTTATRWSHDQEPQLRRRAGRAASRSTTLDIRSPQRKKDVEQVYKQLWPSVEEAIDARDRKLNSMKRGDELPQRRAADGEGLHRHEAA